MQESISPEEKLLNLIKKGSVEPKDALAEKTRPEGPPRRGGQAKQEEPAKEPAVAPKVPITIPRKKRAKGIKTFSILNKIFVICIIGTIIYTVLSYLYAYKSKTQIPERVELKREEGLLEGAPKAPPPLSHYTDILGRRQMFKLYEAPRPTPTGPPKPKVTLQQLLAGYTFVGIIFGEVPQAIVEEKRSGQSFYLTSGQFLGEIKIEKIERGKITVSYEEERLDISI
jgi:hypothetical protein